MWFANHEDPAEIPQLDRIAPRGKADRSVRLITLTIGGNDARFADAWLDCFASHFGRELVGSCESRWGSFMANALGLLRTTLPPLYLELRARAPAARVLVLGYPSPFPARVDATSRCVLWFDRADVRWFHAMTSALNGVIRRAAAGSGAHVEYVAPAGFAGHDVCSQAPWFNPLHLLPGRTRYSFHPNSLGQRRLGALVRAAIR